MRDSMANTDEQTGVMILCLGPCKSMRILKHMKKVGTAFFCQRCIKTTDEARLKILAYENVPNDNGNGLEILKGE